MALERLNRHRKAHRRGAFTLLEVLCATVIGGVLVALGADMAVQAVATRRTVEKELHGRWVEARLLDQFRRDVESARDLTGSGAARFEFGGADDMLLTLHGLALVPNSRSPQPQRLPARIAYMTRKSGSQEPTQLIRSVQLLIESAEGAVQEVMAEGVGQAAISRLIEKEWINRGNTPNSAKAGPAAIRLAVAWADRRMFPSVCTVVVDQEVKTLDRSKE